MLRNITNLRDKKHQQSLEGWSAFGCYDSHGNCENTSFTTNTMPPMKIF